MVHFYCILFFAVYLNGPVMLKIDFFSLSIFIYLLILYKLQLI